MTFCDIIEKISGTRNIDLKILFQLFYFVFYSHTLTTIHCSKCTLEQKAFLMSKQRLISRRFGSEISVKIQQKTTSRENDKTLVEAEWLTCKNLQVSGRDLQSDSSPCKFFFKNMQVLQVNHSTYRFLQINFSTYKVL